LNGVNGADIVFVRCASVCAQRKTSPKRLKLHTINSTSLFPGTVLHNPLKFFWKGSGQGHVTP